MIHKIETNYRTYHFTPKEAVISFLQAFFISILLSYFFYRSFLAAVLFLTLIPFILKYKSNHLCEKRKAMLCRQFREAVLSFSISVQAGNSIENAVHICREDMILLFGSNCFMEKELFILHQSLNNGIPIEKGLTELGNRSGIEEIMDFAEVFRIGKRTGGDMAEILLHTAHLIGEKMETKAEIETLVLAKRMESRIMSLIPFAILAYISVMSPGFFNPLYHNAAGILVMTGCLILYVFALILMKKMSIIEV